MDEPEEASNESLQVKVGSASIEEVQPGFNPSLLADVVKALKTVCGRNLDWLKSEVMIGINATVALAEFDQLGDS